MTRATENSLDDLLTILSHGATGIAAVLALWLVASVAAEVLAGIRGRRSRLLARISAPGARRLASGLAGASVLLAACGTETSAPELQVIGPADEIAGSTATTLAPSTTMAADSTLAPSSSTAPPAVPPSTASPAEPTDPTSPEDQAPTDPDAAPPVDETARTTHRVEVGDSLWSIARARVEAGSDEPVSDAEVARYWRTLVDASRSSLRSGSPDLIHPGEVLDLPAIA